MAPLLSLLSPTTTASLPSSSNLLFSISYYLSTIINSFHYVRHSTPLTLFPLTLPTHPRPPPVVRGILALLLCQIVTLAHAAGREPEPVTGGGGGRKLHTLYTRSRQRISRDNKYSWKLYSGKIIIILVV